MKDLIFGDQTIGVSRPVFVIAELGINHNGNIDRARELIDQAKSSGANAVKLQTYITEKRVAKDAPIFEILKKCEISFDDQKRLFDYARSQDIEIFSTPFDDESVDFLDSIDCPAYKIASFDLVNTKLLSKVASKKRPVIMSRGMANRFEIDRAVQEFKNKGVDLALLHCISAYPVPTIECLNLSTIKALEETYGLHAGFSDHTKGIDASVMAVAAGARIIEKHFTLNCKDEGPDHALSTEPFEMKKMVEEIRRVSMMLGSPVWQAIPVEEDILQYRRPS